MTHLILLLSLFSHTDASLSRTPVQTCVWPNTCAVEQTAKADYEICLWPKKCSGKRTETPEIKAPVLAQFQPCVWPNRCSGKRVETAA